MHRAGEVRMNQLIHTFGIGSVIDLPQLAVMVMGLNDWEEGRCTTLEEPRLLERIRGILGPQVQRLVLPPMPEATIPIPGQRNREENRIGVPVQVFPHWLRCTSCGTLAELDSGLFTLKTHLYRTDKLRYIHVNCAKNTNTSAVPARFLCACPQGHIQDFPWNEFVHNGAACKAPKLRMTELGASGSTADIFLVCDECGLRRSMAQAFDKRKGLPWKRCEGRHPHLHTHETCKEEVSIILLGATNSWFAITAGAISIPEAEEELAQLVEEHWSFLVKVKDPDGVELLRSADKLTAFSAYTNAAIYDAIARRQHAAASEETVDPDPKYPEWRVLIDPDNAPESRDFHVRNAGVPEGFDHIIERVVLVKRLREVRALLGFTRMEAPGDYGEAEDVPATVRVALNRGPAVIVPAAEVRGEGIFIRFSEEHIQKWLERDEVKTLSREFHHAHTAWRAKRGIDEPEKNFPGMRFVLLHSFAHAIMRRIAVECGYSAAGIRERIYSRDPGDAPPMAGVLIYTSAPDSEGTLGGLVQLGQPETLRRIIRYAFEDVALCSSDPLCSSRTPGADGLTLHGASCHACLFSPETSCERGNRYLDRAVLVPIFGRPLHAFFKDEDVQHG
jgi:hypothetical protein